MSYNWCDMPMITCPYCDQEFQLDGYYGYKVDDTFDCYKCEKPILISAGKLIFSVRVETIKGAKP